MDGFGLKLTCLLLALGLIAGAAAGALLYYVFPQFYPNRYLEIALFFLIMEALLVNFVASKSLKVSGKKMVNVYLLAKVVKILLSLIFVTVYILIVKTEIINFTLMFIVFYVVYLFIETYLYAKIEKRLKEKNRK